MTLEGYYTVRCLKDCVLLGPLPKPDKSPGGIHLLGKEKGQMDYFVVGVGPQVKELKSGDFVVTPLYFEHLTLEDGTGRKLVRENQILGVLQET